MLGYRHFRDMNVGSIFSTTYCGDIEIVDYKSANEVIVRFLNTGTIKTTVANRIRTGKVTDPFHPFIANLGYKGVGRFGAKSHKEIYIRWWAIYYRVYISKAYRNTSSYKDCSVDPLWHNFQNFAAWFCDQFQNSEEVYEIDKDLKVEGNKVYGPDTCLLIPKSLNVAMSSDRKTSIAPGVSLRGNKYLVRATTEGVREKIGLYDTLEEASAVFQRYRRNNVLHIAQKLYQEEKITKDVFDLVIFRYK